jgi:hypothetical protein
VHRQYAGPHFTLSFSSSPVSSDATNPSTGGIARWRSAGFRLSSSPRTVDTDL